MMRLSPWNSAILLIGLALGTVLPAQTLQSRTGALIQGNKPRTYIVRVVDSASKAPKTPISHAKVLVEIGDPPQTRKSGYTDARGAFSFTWQSSGSTTKTHITVEAPGFVLIEDFSNLIEERVIELNRIQ
jgi:hypothetical protein